MSGAAVKQTKSANAVPDANQSGNHKSTKLLIFAAVILGIACVTIAVEYALVPERANSHTSRQHEESKQASWFLAFFCTPTSDS